MTHKITLCPKDESGGRWWDIELDGVNISGFVKAVHMTLDAGDIPRFILEVVPREYDMPDELKGVVVATEGEVDYQQLAKAIVEAMKDDRRNP